MKKIILGLVTGVLLLSLAACGKGQAERDYAADFADSVFVGDSVTEGFSFNEVLSSENVLAGAGATVGFSMEDIGAVIERSPKRVYILLGQCDLLMPVKDPLQLFCADYMTYVKTIQEKLPDCEIYMQSITDVSASALEEEPRYEQISVYNKAIQALAKELSVSYIDLNAFASEHSNLYAEDGIHFQKEFYPLWLNYLTKQK